LRAGPVSFKRLLGGIRVRDGSVASIAKEATVAEYNTQNHDAAKQLQEEDDPVGGAPAAVSAEMSGDDDDQCNKP